MKATGTIRQPRAAGARRALSRGVLWVGGGKLVASFLVILANAVLARVLTAEEFGRFLLILSLATVGGTLVLAGLDQAIVRLAAQARGRHDPSGAASVLFSALVLGIFFAVMGGLGVAALFRAGLGDAVFPETPLHDLAAPIGVLTAAVAAQTLAGEAFRAREAYGLATVLGGQGLLGGAVSAGFATVLFVALWAGPWSGAAGDAAFLGAAGRGGAALFGAVLLALFLLRPGSALAFRPGPLLRLGTGLWPTATTLLLLSHVDLWIVGALLGGEVLGYYGAASRLVLLLGIPIFIVNGVLPPLIARLHGAGDREGLEKLLRGSATVMAFPMLALVALLMAAPGSILNAVYGPGYEAGAVVLQILALGWAVNVSSGSPAKLLMMTDGERGLLFVTLVTGAAGALGAVAGAHFWGAAGVASAMAGTLAAQNLLSVSLAKRRHGFWTVLYLTPRGIGDAFRPLADLLRRPLRPVAAPTD